MVQFIKVNGETVEKMEEVNLQEETVQFTKVNGLKENIMEEVNFRLQTEKYLLVHLKMESL